jgi:hypothetical protein
MMTELYLHNRKVDSIFQLLGEHENDISYSVAWALAKCPSFLDAFLQSQVKYKPKGEDVDIRLQNTEGTGGITDIELESLGSFYVIIEAKKGWQLPGHKQLEKYANRYKYKESKAPVKLILALSECSQEYATANLDVREVSDVPVKSVSWKDMAKLASEARSIGSHSEKRIIDELLTYIRGLMSMQNLDSNWVYVVALAQGKPKGWDISWIDIVENRHRYFHPLGGGRGGWPKEPPNYIAFRYNARLQSIHHIEGYEVFTNPHEKFPEIPEKKWPPHFLYKLGRAFGPANEVRTGKIYPNGRVWCMLDTLFTEETISDARDLSKRRMQPV